MGEDAGVGGDFGDVADVAGGGIAAESDFFGDVGDVFDAGGGGTAPGFGDAAAGWAGGGGAGVGGAVGAGDCEGGVAGAAAVGGCVTVSRGCGAGSSPGNGIRRWYTGLIVQWHWEGRLLLRWGKVNGYFWW